MELVFNTDKIGLGRTEVATGDDIPVVRVCIVMRAVSKEGVDWCMVSVHRKDIVTWERLSPSQHFSILNLKPFPKPIDEYNRIDMKCLWMKAVNCCRFELEETAGRSSKVHFLLHSRHSHKKFFQFSLWFLVFFSSLYYCADNTLSVHREI